MIFEAEGSAGAGKALNVTHAVGFDTGQASGVTLPYRKELTTDDASSLYLWVQNGGDQGIVTCRIKIDGVVVKEATSSGGYGVCTARR